MSRDRFARRSLGEKLYTNVKNSRVLLVGAGGIGCELLKNLVMTGFGEVHIVDLDTIDVSNLNRQFLFRHEHVKKPKALVAKETASRFNPNIKIEATHANIKDSQFNVEWFQKFTLVFNALDNLEARRHVNRMCLQAGVTLIESGTTGFEGQVQVIKKDTSECYDCTEKVTPKTFPVCTIRSTPSQPIHCIVWAKSFLFGEVFGNSELEEAAKENPEDQENAKEIEALKKETEELKKIRDSIGKPEFAQLIFDKVYGSDIERLKNMEDMWKTRKAPEPFSYAEVSKKGPGNGAEISREDQRRWSLLESFAVFGDSLKRLSKRAKPDGKEDADRAILEFDKDDEDALDFVAAASNLRALVFGIETKSKFDIKQMAGNIIPAIATTNAMTAALCVLESFKVLRNEAANAKILYLEIPASGRTISSEPLRKPNPSCTVCNKAFASLKVNHAKATLKGFVEDILKSKLSYGDMTLTHENTLLYDPDFEDNLSKTFSELGIKHGSFLTVVDDADDEVRVDLSLVTLQSNFPDDNAQIELPEDIEIAKRPPKKTDDASSGEANGEVSATDSQAENNRKRSASEAGLEENSAPKKGKTLDGSSKADSLVIEDSDDGAITID